VKYSQVPQGTPDIQRIIASNPKFWIAPTLPIILKQKSLVLADWTASCWLPEKIEMVKKKLGKLIDERFLIYMWQDGRVVPMDKHHLSTLDNRDIRKAMTLAYTLDITKVAVAQNKLTHDEVQVLDDYWLNFVLSADDEPGERIIRTSELSGLSDQEVKSLIKILNTSTPKPTKIIHDEFSERACKKFEILTKDKGDIVLEQDYRKASFLFKETIDSLLTGDKKAKVGEFELSIHDLEKIEALDLQRSNISAENLNFLLKTAPSLRTIDLNLCQSLNKKLEISTESLAGLEKIVLSGSNISAENLDILLKGAPNLRTIQLGRCQSLSEKLELAPESLARLEYIDLCGSNISRENLGILLKPAPNLWKINLCHCQSLSEKLELAPESLSHLGEIGLSFSNISAENLGILLKAAPYLWKIDLTHCQSLSEKLELSPGSFTLLEEIVLSGSNISRENLDLILKNAPKLRKIDLGQCKNLGADLGLPPECLANLEDIVLSSSTISRENLNILLKTAPNLRTIALNSCENLSDELELPRESLARLEAIYLFQSNISAENLDILLKAAPNLRTIDLSCCQNLDAELELPRDCHAHLEDIGLYGSNISSENLDILLKAAPNLRKIDLSSCQYLNAELKLPRESLASLEEIVLSGSNISGENLDILLRNTPKLRYINLGSCRNLDVELKLPQDCLANLEEIILSGSNISRENLDILVKAAPNLSECSKQTIKELLSPGKLQNFSASKAAANPEHDSRKMSDFKPKKEPFQFKGANKTKNQGMLIEKLCQYLTLKGKHLDVIPKIQDGMCAALSHYFLSIEKCEWDTFVDMAGSWDGRRETLDEQNLTLFFEALYRNIEQHQLQQHTPAQYIGDALSEFLKTNKRPCILQNPWHAIAIKPVPNGNWYVYDPNYVTGCLEVSTPSLLITIEKAIGKIVSVVPDLAAVEIPAEITNTNYFIEHGGLLALCQCKNSDEMLSKLPREHGYTKAALDGLLLRAISGRPAWVIGLGSKNPYIKAFTQMLNVQFASMNADAVAQLTKSLDALSPMQKGECLANIIQASQSDSGVESTLITAIRKSANQGHYEQALKIWDKTAESAPSVFEYCRHCLSGPTKRLIELDSTQQVDTLRLQLEQLAGHTPRPVFYIDNPEDLICSAPWMEKNQDNLGALHRGPGGPLYTFLKANQHKNPLLIVNYERFNADEMVRFNGLLDKAPNADGVPLPESTQIIGLINRNKPDCYQGSDFYSRFNRTEHCPLTARQLEACTPQRKVQVSTQKIADASTINLYHSLDWENRLMGRWVLDGDKLTFSEGELITAIKAGKPIEIQNGIWGDETFERFWSQALTGGIRHGGRTILIPEDIAMVRPEKDLYEWSNKPTITEGLSVEKSKNILNPTCLGDFLGRYELEGNKLIKKPGLLEQLKDSELIVNMTRTLPDDSWAILLDECHRQNVRLKVHAAPGVSFPEGFSSERFDAPPTIPFDQGITHGLITSTDIDTSVEMLKGSGSYTVIDVSECAPSDLLVKLDGKLNKETLGFEFSQSDSALITALSQGKNIILKGFFSPELMDALAPLLLRQEKDHGNLILVTDDATTGAFISERYFHQVIRQDKLACLVTIKQQSVSVPHDGEPQAVPLSGDIDAAAEQQGAALSGPFPEAKEPKVQVLDDGIIEKLEPYLEKEPLSRLKARYMYLESNPSTKSDNTWLGMTNLPGFTQASTAMLDTTTSVAECTAFTEARLTQVNAVLDLQPYVFLTGLTGVGKSTFVETELCKDNDLYLTEDSIEKWAMDTSDKRKVLFLDEANLSPRQWSEFEGLYQTPPHVLVNGKLHTLSSYHKVVFAGNPVNYGDERTLAPFFERHGNAVLFTPLPPAVIYEKILKPVFENVGIELEPIGQRILDVYRFVCECSSTEILISPRELQMMALMTIANADKYGSDINAIAEHFTYTLARNLVPESKRAGFDAKFTPKNPIVFAPDAKPDRTFFVTESRLALSQQFDDLLGLREWRLGQAALNTAQKGGGLGGLIIEGAPGIGKSELVIAGLIAHDYQEEHDFINPTKKLNLFYRMPVSMPLSEKEALLIKAFNEGAVVVIDEINSSPMMERLLNDLLMGKNPKGQAGDTVKPGFMIIATQNPVTMAGRRAPSRAILRRCITHQLPEYKPDDIQHILVSKGIILEEAQAMTEAYEKNRVYAVKHQLSPAPNFRHLIELADNQLKAKIVPLPGPKGIVQHSIFQSGLESKLQPPEHKP